MHGKVEYWIGDYLKFLHLASESKDFDYYQSNRSNGEAGAVTKIDTRFEQPAKTINEFSSTEKMKDLESYLKTTTFSNKILHDILIETYGSYTIHFGLIHDPEY